MDVNTGLVLIAVVGTIVPFSTAAFTFAHNVIRDKKARDERLAAAAKAEEERLAAAAKVAAKADESVAEIRTQGFEMAKVANGKLDTIHTLVNSQLTEAVNRLKDVTALNVDIMAILVDIAPQDPRVKDLLGRASKARDVVAKQDLDARLVAIERLLTLALKPA